MIRYPCDNCEYAAIHTQDLKRHTESKHEGIRYPCDQCKYATTRPSHIKRHKESKHKVFLRTLLIDSNGINDTTLLIHSEDKVEEYNTPVKDYLKVEDCVMETEIIKRRKII